MLQGLRIYFTQEGISICGIGGIKKLGADPITEDQINILLCSLQHRGTDATGIALMQGNDIHICKQDEEAWKFVTLSKYKAFLREHLTEQVDTVLLHTRAATTGNPRENKNNHPLSLGGAAIVHNGMVTNHSTLFSKWKVDRSAETDSDAIRAVIDRHGITQDAIKEMRDLEGSIAAACIHPDFPGKLLLLRSGSPLVLAQVGTNLMWASEKGSIQKAARPWDQWAGFFVQENKAALRWCALSVDSAFLIGPQGLEFHTDFKTCRFYSTPDYTRLRRDYQERNARWDREVSAAGPKLLQRTDRKGVAVSYYICRNEKCGTALAVPPKFKDVDIATLRCPKCSWFVLGAPVEQQMLVLGN